MSQRTILEINHDRSYEIERKPHEFVAALQVALGSGDDRCWKELERFGIRKGTQAHHSIKRGWFTEYNKGNFS